MSLPVALPQGTVIGGHYIIGDLLNSGGFGAVYRGVDTSEGNRPCAIKETYDVTPAARRQALMEASVLFTVRNQHLPEVYDALEANGRFYLVMQLIEGQNLLQLLRTRVPGGLVGEAEPYRQATGPCTEQEVLTWLLPIIDVLQELHSRNPPIMHRDIKPGNILLTPQQTTVLVDFGLTKLYDPARGTQTLVKAVSVGFSPLEQYMGQTRPQSDIYSMAATMYLLLTNKLPSAATYRSVHDDILPPRQYNPTLSLKTETALLKALAVEADQRYQSMRAFAQALRAPAFTGYADQTIASSPAPFFPSTVIQPTPTPPPPPVASSAIGAPASSAPAKKRTGRSGVHSSPALPSAVGPGTPYIHPTPPSVPGGYGGQVMAPPLQQPMQPPRYAQRPLPAASRQGCLWGLLQGVLAAGLILLAKQQADFYLATGIGFLSYIVAGLRTTRRGGRVSRGGWAGYWAGIYSTIFFWLVLGIGLVVQFFQRLQTLSASSDVLRQHPALASRQAWEAVQPVWPTLLFLPKQPPLVNFVVYLGIGLVVAWLFGLIGGIVGAMNHRARTTASQ